LSGAHCAGGGNVEVVVLVGVAVVVEVDVVVLVVGSTVDVEVVLLVVGTVVEVELVGVIVLGAVVVGCEAVSQLTPLQPDGQAHVYELMPSVQTPPFWQGLAAHSLMFVWHLTPMKPGRQVQV
jgi:hypothetical protein